MATSSSIAFELTCIQAPAALAVLIMARVLGILVRHCDNGRHHQVLRTNTLEELCAVTRIQRIMYHSRSSARYHRHLGQRSLRMLTALNPKRRCPQLLRLGAVTHLHLGRT